MKKIVFLSLFCSSILSFGANNAPITRMAVFPNDIVFTVRRGIIPANSDTLSFFEDEQFFKGSFTLWSKDVTFGIKQMPQKRFNANIYANPNAAFANQNVVVTLKSSTKDAETVSGKLIKIENPDEPYVIPNVIAVQDKVSKQMTYIRINDIKNIRAAVADFMSESYPAPCWIFSRKNTKNALPFEFSYLANGVSWESAVELHLTSKDRMNIIHNAVIRNNGKKFVCPDFYLVSGSPEIAMKNVISLLCSPSYSAAKSYAPAMLKSKSMAMNDMALPESAAYNFSQTSDILYRHLGNFSLDEDESRLVKLQSADNVPCRTIVKWDIPALRNSYGRVIANPERNTAYNMLVFKNHCQTMLDAAPVTVCSDGKILMQTMLNSNTPVNAERFLKISRADNIECKIEENELVNQRVQNVVFNNRRYTKCTFEAVLKVTNFRKEKAAVTVNYNFSGELAESSKNKSILHPNTSSMLNPAGKVKFEFELDANQSKELKIVYTTLMN